MTKVKTVEPREWQTFLNSFSNRNRGRRARFEVFGPNGSFKEEVQEGKFKSISIDANTVTVTRIYEKSSKEMAMTDELTNVRGIAVQYDADYNEDMLEFTDVRGGMTTLHFESRSMAARKGRRL